MKNCYFLRAKLSTFMNKKNNFFLIFSQHATYAGFSGRQISILHRQIMLNHMKSLFICGVYLIFLSVFSACKNNTQAVHNSSSKALSALFDDYWKQKMRLFPFEATAIGDTQYNNLLPVNISDAYRDTLKQFYQDFLQRSEQIKEDLNEEDQVSKDLFAYEMKINLESYQFNNHLMPVNQFWSFTLEFPQLGSGTGNQPFKTPRDYQQFYERMEKFPAWVDQAISNMRRGIDSGIVLPKVLAQKIVPQLQQVLTTDATRNIFYQPIHHLPVSFSVEEKQQYKNAYQFAINTCIIPAYHRLKTFLEKEYIPACRSSAGISSIPGGKEYYAHLIRWYTTTDLTPDSIYQLGLQEVARIRKEMEQVKTDVGFTDSLPAFFEFMNRDRQFYPFSTAAAVLDSFRAIQKIIDPQLRTIFESQPKTKFEIRQTEAFRAASASAEYNAGSEDGTRPGIFYVPVIDPAKFNIIGMETLFLHEAIPGHHYQISLQQENNSLPKFRKFLGYGAYTEGWALYTETLGRQLGLYKNPYQYFGHLSDAMHRAIRLVVDVAIHTRNMSREDAIAYMMANERISEEEATAEIERYMAIPGQALSYKIGQLGILALKQKYEQKLGAKFSLSAFHTQVLNGGNMPLQVLEKKLALWAKNL